MPDTTPVVVKAVSALDGREEIGLRLYRDGAPVTCVVVMHHEGAVRWAVGVSLWTTNGPLELGDCLAYRRHGRWIREPSADWQAPAMEQAEAFALDRAGQLWPFDI